MDHFCVVEYRIFTFSILFIWKSIALECDVNSKFDIWSSYYRFIITLSYSFKFNQIQLVSLENGWQNNLETKVCFQNVFHLTIFPLKMVKMKSLLMFSISRTHLTNKTYGSVYWYVIAFFRFSSGHRISLKNLHQQMFVLMLHNWAVCLLSRNHSKWTRFLCQKLLLEIFNLLFGSFIFISLSQYLHYWLLGLKW